MTQAELSRVLGDPRLAQLLAGQDSTSMSVEDDAVIVVVGKVSKEGQPQVTVARGEPVGEAGARFVAVTFTGRGALNALSTVAHAANAACEDYDDREGAA